MKSLILFVVGALLACTCQGADRQIQMRLARQQDRIDTINQQIDQEKKTVDQWYAREMENVRLAAEREAGYLLASERMLISALTTGCAQHPVLLDRWGSFFPRTASILQSRGLINTSQRRTALKLFQAAKDHYYLDKTKKLLTDKDFHALLEDIVNSTQFVDDNAILLRYEAGKLLAIMDNLSEETQRIENLKKAWLATLDEKARSRKSDVYKVIHDIETRPSQKPTGTVAAICCSSTDSFCMIESVDGLVRQGAILPNGIKVLEILENKVRFKHNETTWEQKIGQKPDPRWK